MPEQTPKSRSEFKKLNTRVSKALEALTQRRTEARTGGDTALSETLFDERQRLVVASIDIRRAEIAYLNSPLHADAAVSRLRETVSEADAGLLRLRQLATALAGAAMVLNAVTRVAVLFP